MAITNSATRNIHHSVQTTQRMAGACTIIKMASRLASQRHLSLAVYSWNHGQGLEPSRSHCLDLGTAQTSAREYFSDQELTDYCVPHIAQAIEIKIVRMVTRLAAGSLN